jgi:hypothetical protein
MLHSLYHMEGTLRNTWLPSKSLIDLVMYEFRSVVCLVRVCELHTTASLFECKYLSEHAVAVHLLIIASRSGCYCAQHISQCS